MVCGYEKYMVFWMWFGFFEWFVCLFGFLGVLVIF